MTKLGHDFSIRLKSLVKAKNLPQRQLSKEIGVSTTTLQRWLNGQIPSDESLDLLSKYFNVEPEWFLGLDVDKRHSMVFECMDELRGIKKKENLERALYLIRQIRQAEDEESQDDEAASS